MLEINKLVMLHHGRVLRVGNSFLKVAAITSNRVNFYALIARRDFIHCLSAEDFFCVLVAMKQLFDAKQRSLMSNN